MVVMIMALTMRRMMIMMVIMTLWQGTHSTKVNCKQGNAIPQSSVAEAAVTRGGCGGAVVVVVVVVVAAAAVAVYFSRPVYLG